MTFVDTQAFKKALREYKSASKQCTKAFDAGDPVLWDQAKKRREAAWIVYSEHLAEWNKANLEGQG